MISVCLRASLFCCLLFFGTISVATGSHAADMPAANEGFAGKVLETMDAAGYTYVQIDTSGGPLWAALPQSVVKVGDEISIVPGMEMKDFHSNALDRTFPRIVFSPGIVGATKLNPHQTPPPTEKSADDSFAAAIAAEQQAATGRQIQPAQSSGGSLGAIVPFKEISVEKATGENAYTVGEIFAKAKDLDGQMVRVRGQVVKFNANIMGKNWIHLQDGSGNPMENTHDLVVTTKEEISGPEVVTVAGRLAVDKDFGAGYKYPVIIEDAVISK